MCHADALSRSVNRVDKDLNLSRETVPDEQEKDDTCMKYRPYENYWVDKEEVLSETKRTTSHYYTSNFSFHCADMLS